MHKNSAFCVFCIVNFEYIQHNIGHLWENFQETSKQYLCDGELISQIPEQHTRTNLTSSCSIFRVLDFTSSPDRASKKREQKTKAPVHSRNYWKHCFLFFIT